MSDDGGQYRIVDLRPGAYTVTFTLPGFATLKREGIELSGGFTATINAELRVGAVEETVTVTGESPVVDVQNTRQQTVISNNLFMSIPSAPTFQGVGALLPGLLPEFGRGNFAGSQDVGGNTGEPINRLTVNGSRPNDASALIDGFQSADFSGAGSRNNIFTSPVGIAEYVFDTGGISADASSGGVRTTIIPKEGGNRFSATLAAAFTNTSLTSQNLTKGTAIPSPLIRTVR